jgi:biopolymer transport protein ExbB/TolQ
MSDSLSPLAWVLIILLAVFIIAINLSLFLGMRKKKSTDNWVNRMINTTNTARDPFRKENQKIDELSRKVRELESKNGNEINDN